MMAWAPHRRYTYSGAELPTVPPPPTTAASLPFPGMQPRHLLRSPLGSSHFSPPAGSQQPSPASSQQQLEPLSPCDAPVATADEEALQSLLSALRVALAKKESALVSVAGQLAEVQGRLDASETERQGLAARLRDVAPPPPDRLAAAASVTPEGRLLAAARQEVGQEAACAAQLAAERDTLAADVSLLQQQLMATVQAEAQERERLCAEATQNRLLARARARQVEQLQAELARAAGERSSTAAAQHADAAEAEAATVAAQSAAGEAAARAAAAEETAARLQHELGAAQEAECQAEARAAQAEAELAEARQQAEWAALRISELEQSSTVGQLLRKYEGEMQRLRTQHDADRRDLQQQLAAARQQAAEAAAVAAAAAAPSQQATARLPPAQQQQPSLDNSAAWAALFEDPSQQEPPEVEDVAVQTDEGSLQQLQQPVGADPALLEAARLEIERLQDVNADLLASQTQAHSTMQDALEQQRAACLACDRESAARQSAVSEHQMALDAAQRAKAGLREQLQLAERRLVHQAGEVAALREANEKLELAVAGLKEDLAVAGQAPQQQLEELQAELLRALAHTGSLEAQVQQLKQAAAFAAEQHAAAVQQQAQDGALDVAEQVAAAVDAAAGRYEQQVQALQAQLAEAQLQLEAARSKLAAAQEQRESQMNQAVQVGCSAAEAQHAAVQTDPEGVRRAWVLEPLPPPQQQHQQASPATSMWQQWPSRGGSACESPAFGGGNGPAAAPPVALTATQLQLELARLKITPMKHLPGSCLQRTPSRLGSACGELGGGGMEAQQQQRSNSWGAGGGGASLVPRWQASGLTVGLLATACGSDNRLAAEDEEDACYATPLAQTPTSISPAEPSPFSAPLSPAASAWMGDGLAQQQQQQQQRRYEQPPVPVLDLHLVPPYTSISYDSGSGRGEGCSGRAPPSSSVGGGSWVAAAAEASTSVSSLSSLGPSASQRASWAPSGGGGSSNKAAADAEYRGNVLFSGGGSSSWQAASLDASLARLAALTAGLTGSRNRAESS